MSTATTRRGVRMRLNRPPHPRTLGRRSLAAAAVSVLALVIAAWRCTRWCVRRSRETPAPPTISGTAVVGQTLNGTQGTWSPGGTGSVTLAHQWRRCDASGSSLRGHSRGNGNGPHVRDRCGGLRRTLRLRETATDEHGISDAGFRTDGRRPRAPGECRRAVHLGEPRRRRNPHVDDRGMDGYPVDVHS